jgi:alpha-N-arabinofuranosidase
MITQRHLDERRANPITSTGHADFVETQNGEWWAVFLGCRPYSGDLYNTGRETFMMPVSWNNGWPFISDSAVPYVAKRPGLPENLDNALPTSGNFMWRDDFNDTTLAMNWNFLRTPGKVWYSLNTQPGYLQIDLQPVSIQELAQPSFIGRRQQHGSFSASAAIQPFNFDTASTGGLVAFQNEKNYLFLGIKKAGKDFIAFLERTGSDEGDGHPQLLASVILTRKPGTVYLKIDGKGSKYDFSYSLDKENWIVLKSEVDAKNLSTNVAGGFVGTYLGLYGSIKHSRP